MFFSKKKIHLLTHALKKKTQQQNKSAAGAAIRRLPNKDGRVRGAHSLTSGCLSIQWPLAPLQHLKLVVVPWARTTGGQGHPHAWHSSTSGTNSGRQQHSNHQGEDQKQHHQPSPSPRPAAREEAKNGEPIKESAKYRSGCLAGILFYGAEPR